MYSSMSAYASYSRPTNIKAEVMYALQECRDRCLHQGTKFLSEMLVALKDIPPFFDYENKDHDSVRFEFEPAFVNLQDYLVYCKARSYFDVEDYPGCAHISKYSNISKTMFLHYMSRYLSMHNESIYDQHDIFDSYKPSNMSKFMELLNELLILNVYESEEGFLYDESHPQEISELDSINHNSGVQQQEDDSTPKGRRCIKQPSNQRIKKVNITTVRQNNNKGTTKCKAKTKNVKISPVFAAQSEINTLTSKESRIEQKDPYLLWLTAVMLKRVDRHDEAIEILVRAIRLQPCHWGAWIELSTLVKDLKMLQLLNLQLMENNKHHWMHPIFVARVFIDFQIIDGAIKVYSDILNYGHSAFQSWPYIHAQLGVAYFYKHSMTKETSLKSFGNIIKLDPFRIDNFDLLSTLFFTYVNHEEMVNLSKYVASVDPFRQESLCVFGNLYSMIGDHYKSVLYLKQALRLNPFNEIAWTVLGHEYVALKNPNAAVVSYLRVLTINPKSYKAYFGLGKIYELLNMPNYSLLYYAQARKFKPNDVRAILSLGHIYDQTNRIYETLVCFYKALHSDIGEFIFTKLSKFYETYGSSSNQTTRDHFNTLNKTALKTVMKNKNDEELNLILSKIYLFLGHYYMDLKYYERATNFVDKCHYLCNYMDKSASYYEEFQESVNDLMNKIKLEQTLVLYSTNLL